MTTSEPASFPSPKTLADVGIVLAGSFDADGLLGRPELACAVMTYIGHISELDLKLECAALLAIGGGSGLADALLAGMSPLDHSHRRSAIEAILRKKGQISRSELEKLFSGIKPARDLRNSFAHGIWCTHDQLPDALILARSYDELRRFGLGLDTARREPLRRAAFDFLAELLRHTESLPPNFGPAATKLFQELSTPWDLAFSAAAQEASAYERQQQKDWFDANPKQNIDWSKVRHRDESVGLSKSTALALGASVHDSAQVWDKETLGEALTYARYAKERAEELKRKLFEVQSEAF